MIAALAGSGRLDISSPVDMREALWVMMTQVPRSRAPPSPPSISSWTASLRRPDGQVIRDTDLPARPAARPGALPRAADLASHLLGRAVLERVAEAAGAQRAHADPAHRRRLHRRPVCHGGASATSS
jgi:hypothetical protein